MIAISLRTNPSDLLGWSVESYRVNGPIIADFSDINFFFCFCSKLVSKCVVDIDFYAVCIFRRIAFLPFWPLLLFFLTSLYCWLWLWYCWIKGIRRCAYILRQSCCIFFYYVLMLLLPPIDSATRLTNTILVVVSARRFLCSYVFQFGHRFSLENILYLFNACFLSRRWIILRTVDGA